MDIGVERIFDTTPSRSIKAGQIILFEGDPIRDLFYIIDGYIKVYNVLLSGVERIIFIYGPGDAFPFTSFLSGTGSVRYFYEAMTPVRLRSMSNRQLSSRVKNNLQMGEALINYTSRVNIQFMQRIDILSVNDSRRKVVALLAFLAIKFGGKGSPVIGLPFRLTHQDIADMSGLTRETATIQLSRLKKEGVIHSTRLLTIDTDKLNRLKSRLAIS